MLVLSRKNQEQIRIGEGITITVLSIKGSVVRLGIEAPREVRVIRAELPPREASSENVESKPDSADDLTHNCRPHSLGLHPRAQCKSQWLSDRIRNRIVAKHLTSTSVSTSTT